MTGLMDFSYETQTQLSHIGWAAFLVLTFWLLIDLRPRLCAGIVLGLSGIKEFIIERFTESRAVQGSPWRDFIFCAVGAGIAILVIAGAMTAQHFQRFHRKR